MPARGYEFYLRVINLISHSRSPVTYRVEHSKIKFVSTIGHVIPTMYLGSFFRIASRTFREKKTTAKPTLFRRHVDNRKELERVKGKGRISLEPKNMKKS